MSCCGMPWNFQSHLHLLLKKWPKTPACIIHPTRRHPFSAILAVCPPTHQHIRPWSLQWIPGPETYRTTTGIAPLADHGLHGWVRLFGTPDSLLPTHGLLLTTGHRGGRYDPQPVTRSSEWVSGLIYRKKLPRSFLGKTYTKSDVGIALEWVMLQKFQELT